MSRDNATTVTGARVLTAIQPTRETTNPTLHLPTHSFERSIPVQSNSLQFQLQMGLILIFFQHNIAGLINQQEVPTTTKICNKKNRQQWEPTKAPGQQERWRIVEDHDYRNPVAPEHNRLYLAWPLETSTAVLWVLSNSQCASDMTC